MSDSRESELREGAEPTDQEEFLAEMGGTAMLDPRLIAEQDEPHGHCDGCGHVYVTDDETCCEHDAPRNELGEIVWPEFHWTPIGEEREPGGMTALLLGTIVIGGASHHVTAYQIAPDPDETGLQDPLQGQTTFDAIYAAESGDGPWETVQIDGREYVLIISPYCR